MSNLPDSATLAYKPPEGASQEFRLDSLCYAASAEWIVLRKKEKPVAEIFCVHYRALATQPRPLTFVFNGGPGASSAYLHLGAMGPKRVFFQDTGGLSSPPSRLVDNAESWLKFTDLVFIDPVGTGFSRIVEKPDKTEKEVGKDKKEDNEFYDSERDLQSLCEFISKFLSRHRLWSRPVFLAGESYGGFRVGKMARQLQENFGVGLNGVILISPGLELGLIDVSDYDLLGWSDLFPSMALAAFHHGRSRRFPANTPWDVVAREAEQFASQEMVVLLASGEHLALERRQRLCADMADFLGLSVDFVAKRGGRITYRAFTRELLRDQRLVCGIYDASVTAVDPFPDREEFQGGDPTLRSVERVFTGAINTQLRENLGLDCPRDYRLLNFEVSAAWKIEGEHALTLSKLGATDDLRYGLCLNPDMLVFLCYGRFDLATPYFTGRRLLSLMKLHTSQVDRVVERCYAGGHMFYTWREARQCFFEDAQNFYAEATKDFRANQIKSE